MTDTLHFFQRTFPSANMILLKGDSPVLVDTGFGSDIGETIIKLTDIGYPPERLTQIVNTHWHCDHSGGNHHLQTMFGIPISAHQHEADIINTGDSDENDAHWLSQPIEPYAVDVLLNDGDVITTGTRQWQVIEANGHTNGHIALYRDGILICGDTFHDDDIAWLNLFSYPNSLDTIRATLDKFAQLPLKISYSGHGAACHDPLKRIDQARHRYDRWAKQPEKIAWHAMKRIFVYQVMLSDGMDEASMKAYLRQAAWYQDITQNVFDSSPDEFYPHLMAELERSQAAYWDGDQLMPTAPYNPVPESWLIRVVGTAS